jgi:hypothetical protein
MLAAADRPLCETDGSVDRIGLATKVIFGVVDCPDCLRRAIAESDERARVLRDLLGRAEALS